MFPKPATTGIKVLAFDQGGIYLGVDYAKTTRAFEKLGARNAASLYTQAEQTQIVDEFERGKVPREVFYQYLRDNLQGLRADVTDNELDLAWNAMLTGVIPGVLEFIHELRELGYITIVVSNADIIHQEGVEEQIVAAGVQTLFAEQAFNKKYISYRFGFNKPYVEMFMEVTKDLQLTFPAKNIKPSEILFIDDSEKHLVGRNMLEGAAKVGWQTLLVSSNLPVDEFGRCLDKWLKMKYA